VFSVEQVDGQTRVAMAATLENIDRADKLVCAFLDALRVAVDRFAVRLLAREALLNAVMHGSQLDPCREARFTIGCDDEAVVMTVEDDGPGFDWRAHRGIRSERASGGRGVSLMRLYATEVFFNATGNCVTLRRRFADAEAPATCQNEEHS
jgi:anti-sigma regulatory factor (Ser/Thr protein kinase)